jgi:hypothetical protein
VTANYLNGIGGTISTNAFTPLGVTFPLVTNLSGGSAITMNPDGTINLAANQTYYVDYQVDAVTPPMVNSGAQLNFNGTFVPGTGVRYINSGTITVQTGLAANAIVQTGATAGTLALAVNSNGGTSTFSGPTVSVFKLA